MALLYAIIFALTFTLAIISLLFLNDYIPLYIILYKAEKINKILVLKKEKTELNTRFLLL